MNKSVEVPFWQKTFLHVRGLGLNRWKPLKLKSFSVSWPVGLMTL